MMNFFILRLLRPCVLQFGGGGVDTSSSETAVDEDEKKAKAIRSALYKTAGGSAGQELSGEEVKKRETLFGN